jgi:hypothetical protein
LVLKADALEVVRARSCATKLVFRASDPEKAVADQPPIPSTPLQISQLQISE